MIINGETSVYGIIGYPVKHSKSPIFQTKAFEYLRINAVYIPFEVKPENLQTAIKGLKALSVKGVNVTIPHKEEMIKYINEISQEAKIIKAVNTLKIIDGYIIGYNTDAYGFITGLKELEPDLSGKTALVLGAGGASRAVIYSLITEGVKIYIANRTKPKVEQIIDDFKTLTKYITDFIQYIEFSKIEEILKEVDIIINTTSVGLKDEDPELFDYSRIEKKHIVVDIIYKETKLLKKAKEIGCKYQDGLPMLIYQGAKSFEIWTGRKAPVEIMKNSISMY